MKQSNGCLVFCYKYALDNSIKCFVPIDLLYVKEDVVLVKLSTDTYSPYMYFCQTKDEFENLFNQNDDDQHTVLKLMNPEIFSTTPREDAYTQEWTNRFVNPSSYLQNLTILQSSNAKPEMLMVALYFTVIHLEYEKPIAIPSVNWFRGKKDQYTLVRDAFDWIDAVLFNENDDLLTFLKEMLQRNVSLSGIIDLPNQDLVRLVENTVLREETLSKLREYILPLFYACSGYNLQSSPYYTIPIFMMHWNKDEFFIYFKTQLNLATSFRLGSELRHHWESWRSTFYCGPINRVTREFYPLTTASRMKQFLNITSSSMSTGQIQNTINVLEEGN